MKGSPADQHQTAYMAEAKRYAVKLLRYRLRSKKEMLQRLKRKGFDGLQIKATMRFLENAGWLEDEVTASVFLKQAVERKHLGKDGIRMFLFEKGIEKDLVDKTVSGVSEDIEKDTALKLVKKKLRGMRNCPENKKRQRLYGMLRRRGFSFCITNETVRSLERK